VGTKLKVGRYCYVKVADVAKRKSTPFYQHVEENINFGEMKGKSMMQWMYFHWKGFC